MAKKLEWVEKIQNRCAVANTKYGRYCVLEVSGGWDIDLNMSVEDGGKFQLWIDKTKEHTPTMDEAKAAAQRDYELRCDAEAGRLGAEPMCEWRVSDFGEGEYWATQCGNAWCFDDEDGRLARDAVFCPNCGKRVEYVEEAHPQPLPEGGE